MYTYSIYCETAQNKNGSSFLLVPRSNINFDDDIKYCQVNVMLLLCLFNARNFD